MNYKLSHEALEDLDTLLFDIAVYSGWERSMQVEEQLFRAFDEISLTPGIGHLRTDLIPADLYVHLSEPYLIVHRRDTKPPIILAVLHSARDIATVLRQRDA